MNDLFSVANAAVLPGWLILLFAPRGRWPMLDRVPALFLPSTLSALYSGLILTAFGPSGGGFGTLQDVRLLMSSDAGLLAGWVHYLAFDLMVGALMATRMDAIGTSRLIQAPLLLLVFLFGPMGVFLILAMGLAQLKSAPLASTKYQQKGASA